MGEGMKALRRVRIGPASLTDIESVALRMRADEQAQWLSITGRDTYDPWLCARTLAGTPGPQYVLVDGRGVPFAVGGMTEIRPKVWQTWAAATDTAWDDYWREITGHCRRMIRDVLESGAGHRVETLALASRTRAHAWYEAGLGQRFEGVLRSYFADGQDAVVYSRVRNGSALPRRRKEV